MHYLERFRLINAPNQVGKVYLLPTTILAYLFALVSKDDGAIHSRLEILISVTALIDAAIFCRK